jgi:hypothetical protein
MYFDYGTTEWISRANLRHLHKDFALLPAQAIRCRLASIRPILGVREWSQEAGEEFLRLVMKTGEEGLVAMVRGYSKPHVSSLDFVNSIRPKNDSLKLERHLRLVV